MKYKKLYFTVEIEYSATDIEQAVKDIHNQVKDIGDWSEIINVKQRDFGKFYNKSVNFKSMLLEEE